MMRRISFLVLVLEGLVRLHSLFNFSFFSMTGRGLDLDYCDIEWFALETNRDHFVAFEKQTEIILSLLRLYPSTAFQTPVHYEGYSISSKGFLPTVVDIMDI